MTVDAVWDWLTTIPVAIWASIITGVMTLGGVVLSQYLLQRRRERQKEEELDALRNALAVELRAYDDVLEQLLYVTYDMEKFREKQYALTDEQYSEAFESDAHAKVSFYVATGSRRSFSDEVYRSNADKIGELDKKTARLVVQTYDMMRRLDRRLENLSDAIDTDQLMAIDSDVDWSTGAGLDPEVILRQTEVEGAVPLAAISQKFTIAFLDGGEISKKDRALVAYAYKHAEPQSEQQAEMKRYIEAYMAEHDLSTPEEIVKGDHPAAEEEA